MEEFVLEGKQKPFEMARSEINDIMLSQRQASYMEQVKSDLYTRYLEMGKIKYFNHTQQQAEQ